MNRKNATESEILLILKTYAPNFKNIKNTFQLWKSSFLRACKAGESEFCLRHFWSANLFPRRTAWCRYRPLCWTPSNVEPKTEKQKENQPVNEKTRGNTLLSRVTQGGKNYGKYWCFLQFKFRQIRNGETLKYVLNGSTDTPWSWGTIWLAVRWRRII